MSTESIVSAPFRLAFPEVFKPKAAQEGGNAKYSVTMLFPKDNSPLIPSLNGALALMAIRKLLFDAVKEKWGEDKSKWPASIRAIDFKTYVSPNGKDGWPLRDGDLVEWDGFGGMFFIRASSQFQPGLVNAKLQPVLDPTEVYGGLICRAQINAYAYDTNGNRGVTLGLNNLQILKDDGTIFGGKQNAADVFDAFGEAGGKDAFSDAFDDDPPL